MIMKYSKIITVSVCFFFMTFVGIPSHVHANTPAPPQLVTLQEGKCAPFTGTLFSTEAAAQLLVDLETRKQQCELRKDKALSLLRADLQLQIDLKQAQLDALQYKHTNILSIKEDQIDFLKGQLKPPSWYESGEFWFAMGIVGGILITVGAGYAIGQASK